MARARKTTSSRQPRKSTASGRPTAAAAAAVTPVAATPPGETAASESARVAADLAGGLRSFLDTIESEVRAVSALSQRIDDLVGELNAARAEQAERLLALDALQGAAQDGGLTSFLGKLIRPRMPRVTEVVPDRLA
jgi:hypothetical protein